MARTKGTARKYSYRLRHRGWHATARAYGTVIRTTPVCQANGSMIVVVPSPLALDGVRLHTNCGIERPRPIGVANTASEAPSDHSGGLLDLPNEILLAIFRLLLPVGQAWHFTPMTKRKIHAICVHRLSLAGSPLPHAPEDSLRNVPTLSSICRHLTEITYAVFFGQNQFVLEIASRGITSHICCEGQGLESWSKILRTKPAGLAPLSQISARYLTSLTLCLSLTGRQPGGYEWKRLDESIQRIVEIFDGSRHELKMLSVHLGILQRIGSRTNSKALEMDLTDGLRMRIRKDQVARDRVPAATLKTLADVVAPLIRLEGVRETKLSGLLTNETINAYDEGNDEGRKKMATDGGREHRSAKRQRCH